MHSLFNRQPDSHIKSFSTATSDNMSNRYFQRMCQSLEMEPMDDSSDNSNQTWLQDGLNSMQLKRSEMNELVMDYLLHEGFKEAAERFREEAGIELMNSRLSAHSEQSPATATAATTTHRSESTTRHGTSSCNVTTNNGNDTRGTHIDNRNDTHEGGSVKKELTKHLAQNVEEYGWSTNLSDWLSKSETPEMMDRRVEVRHLVEQGDILKAQSMINLYYPELLDTHRRLYFKLQQQHLIELIRQQKINEVLTFVHDQLSVDELRDLTEMERTLALLAYEDPDKSPYAGLLQASHRLQLACEINDIILQETSGAIESTKPRLVTLIKLLFWTQSELEKKKIPFPKMTDLVDGTILEPKF